MYMVGRAKYGLKTPCKKRTFLQSKNTPVGFGVKIRILHIYAEKICIRKYRNKPAIRYFVEEVMTMSTIPIELYEETLRERLLSLIAVCGEFPAMNISL